MINFLRNNKILIIVSVTTLICGFLIYYFYNMNSELNNMKNTMLSETDENMEYSEIESEQSEQSEESSERYNNPDDLAFLDSVKMEENLFNIEENMPIINLKLDENSEQFSEKEEQNDDDDDENDDIGKEDIEQEILSDTDSLQIILPKRCQTIFHSGKKKGQICNAKVVKGKSGCKRHSK